MTIPLEKCKNSFPLSHSLLSDLTVWSDGSQKSSHSKVVFLINKIQTKINNGFGGWWWWRGWCWDDRTSYEAEQTKHFPATNFNHQVAHSCLSYHGKMWIPIVLKSHMIYRWIYRDDLEIAERSLDGSTWSEGNRCNMKY